jgi:hypothetical protein
MRILPQLEFLNSLPVDREAMEEEGEDEIDGNNHRTINNVRVDEVIHETD